MKLTVGLLLAAISLMAIVPAAQAVTTSSGSGSAGFVAYTVQATFNGTARTASVNESVTPSSSPGDSILLLAVSGTESNFTYSHVVNSSSTLFPYMPGITNQSYTYSNDSYTVSASITQQGTSSVTFQGASYTLTDYGFSATISSPNGTDTITGSVSTFPSDLVYSVSAHGTTTSATATLTATSLPLSGAAAAPGLQAASAGVGLSLAAGAIALSLGVKLRNKPKAEGPKPDHWVD